MRREEFKADILAFQDKGSSAPKIFSCLADLVIGLFVQHQAQVAQGFENAERYEGRARSLCWDWNRSLVLRIIAEGRRSHLNMMKALTCGVAQWDDSRASEIRLQHLVPARALRTVERYPLQNQIL